MAEKHFRPTVKVSHQLPEENANEGDEIAENDSIIDTL